MPEGTDQQAVDDDTIRSVKAGLDLEAQLAKSRKWVEALGSALIALFIILVITVVTVCTNTGERDRQEQEKLAPLKAQLEECRQEHGAMLATLNKYAIESTPCPTCPECPPAPTCPTTELDECRRELNWREQKVDFGEWFAKMQLDAEEKINAWRNQYFTRLEEFQPLVARANEMGIGPRARDWINKPGAVELYLELGDRWTELEQLYGQMKQVIQDAEHTAEMTCYQNLAWSWEEILPDERDHDRLQQEAYRLTDGNYHVYLYELERRARNQAEQP